MYIAILHNKLTHCALHIPTTSDDDDDDDDDDDVHLYSAVTPCYCSMLGALGRVVSLEACCQWALLSVQITRHYTTLQFKFTVKKYMYPSVSKVHAGSVRVPVIHRTLTLTKGSLSAYVIILISVCILYTHGGWVHRQRDYESMIYSQNNNFDSEKFTKFACAPDGVRTRVTDVIESRDRRSNNGATLSPQPSDDSISTDHNDKHMQ